MENYKGFFIDEDISDHSVTVLSKEYNIKYSTGNRKNAKAYIDGFADREKYIQNKDTWGYAIASIFCNKYLPISVIFGVLAATVTFLIKAFICHFL